MPRSPLPLRHGLNAAWARTPDRDPAAPAPWVTIADWLRHKFPEHVDVDGMLARRIPARPSVVRPMASGRLKPSRGDPK